MADWIAVDVNLTEHRKFLRLRSFLELDEGQALKVLHRLWALTFKQAPSGDLSDFQSSEIAFACDWFTDHNQGPAGEDLVSALVRAGFLDRRKGSLLVHNWEEFGGRLEIKRQKGRSRQAKYRLIHTPESSHDNDSDVTAALGDAGVTQPERGERGQREESLGILSSRSASRPGAREAKPDPTEKESQTTRETQTRAAISNRLWQIAGPDTDPDDVGELVEREVARLEEAIAGAAKPDVYRNRVTLTYEPREDVIDSLKLLQDAARAERYGPRPNGDSGEPGHVVIRLPDREMPY